MKAIVRTAMFMLIVVTAIGAQHRKQDKPLPDDLYQLYLKKSEMIADAIKNSTNEWAGTYIAGDHHPTVLKLEPNAGFVVGSSRHTFSPSWINYGKVTITNSLLRVYPELEKENVDAHIMPAEFRLVRWGRQHFLLSTEEFESFAYAVHARDESWIVQYFVRAEDRDERRGGLPDLPQEFSPVMRMRPITARVIAVGSQEGLEQTVTIDAGSEKKLGKGMFLYYTSKAGYQYSIRITEVSPRSATGTVWMRATTGNATSTDVPIRNGQRLISRMPRDFVQPG